MPVSSSAPAPTPCGAAGPRVAAAPVRQHDHVGTTSPSEPDAGDQEARAALFAPKATATLCTSSAPSRSTIRAAPTEGGGGTRADEVLVAGVR